MSRIGARVAEAAKLKFRRVVIPQANLAGLEHPHGIEITAMSDIRQTLGLLLD